MTHGDGAHSCEGSDKRCTGFCGRGNAGSNARSVHGETESKARTGRLRADVKVPKENILGP